MSLHPKIPNSLLGPSIPQNSISAVLLSRGDGKFHWALGLAIPDRPFAFRKLHATQLNGPAWEFEDVAHDIVELKSRKPVCVIMQVGLSCGTNTPDDIARLMSKIPMQLSVREEKEPVFTCRVWLREALRVLQNHGVIGVLDINKLEEEFVSLGEENDSNVIKGGPHKVYHSKNYGYTVSEA